MAKELLDELRHIWALYSSFSETSAFPVVLYALWSVYSLFSSVSRFARWYAVQREASILVFGISKFFVMLAFAGAALLTAPHPRYNFSYLVPYARLCWAIALITFAIATHLEGLVLARIIHDRRDDLPVTRGEIHGNKSLLHE
jgi:hypothetical protein